MNGEICFINATGEIEELPIYYYPDHTPLVKWEHKDGFPPTILVRPSTLSSFMAAMFWVQSMGWRGDHIKHLILPFVPGARQDRLNPTGDSLFTAKSVAGIINSCMFESVWVLDPHSDVTPGLIDRCQVLHVPAKMLPNDYVAVVSPDAGAEKRAGKIAKKMGVPLIHAWKTRNVTDGNISGFGVEPTVSCDGARKVLVVDDICDGGGTFTGLGDVLRSRGFEPDLFVTHGIFSKGPFELQKRYNKIFCTDSLPTIFQPQFTVIPFCEQLLKEGIKY